MLGIPHEFLSVILTGTPISSSTFSWPASCWGMLLNNELYPNRASFTLFGAKIWTLDRTHLLTRVHKAWPSVVIPAMTVPSSGQIDRPIHTDVGLVFKL